MCALGKFKFCYVSLLALGTYTYIDIKMHAWVFVLVISVALFWVGESYVAGLGGPFVASALLFIVALMFSAVVLQETKK
jgi:hypothetical protein